MKPSAEVILASAGSGKTFQLTLRYAALVLNGVPLKNILAATFTRKAAGEIQSRVLERLAGAAEGGADLGDLREFMKRPDLSAKDCTDALARVVADMPQMRIKTLDGWFAQMARAFAPDLGLDSDWALLEEVEDRELQVRSVEELLAGLDSEQRNVLLSDLQKGGHQAGVISQLLKSIHVGRSRQRWAEPGAWDQVQVPDAPSEAVWQAVLDDMEGWDMPKTKKGEPSKPWEKAVRDFAASLVAEDWHAALFATIFQRHLDGGTFYKGEIPTEWREPLEVIRIRLAHEILGAVRKQNLAMAQILEKFDGIHSRLQRAEGGLRFDDLSALLALSASGEFDFDLAYRLDAQLDHVLLDEYQDTNALQHASLDRTLIELASDREGKRSMFVVGDPNQSIYGFRQAEPRLLIGLSTRLSLKPDPLTKNWRSSPVVLDAVNQLFNGIAGAAPFSDNTQKHIGRQHLREAAYEWQKAFSDHTPCEKNADLPGSVHVWQAPEGEDQSKDELLDYAADHVAKLHKKAPKAVIAVLTRSKNFGQQMIARLALRDVAAAGDGGHTVTDCELVRAFLALLFLVDHPGDGHAWAMVAGSPLASILDLKPEDGLDGSPAVARRARTEILSEGLGPWLVGLRDKLGELTPFEDQRMDSLVTAAHAWSDRIGVRLSTFYDHVLGMKVGLESDALVRVVTIHAAKGLEYDAVVLPELISAIEKSPPVVSSRPDAYGKIEAMSLYQKPPVQALCPELKRLHDAEAQARLHDTLCTLYVGMTRAKYSLDLILPAELPTVWNNRSFAGIVRSIFPLAFTSEDVPLWSHPDSSDDWHACLKDRKPEPQASPRKPLALKAGGALRALTNRSPSAAEGGQSKTVTQWLDVIPAGAADRGTLVHEWLREIEWLDPEGSGPAAEDLSAIAARLGISKHVVPSVEELLGRSLAIPAIKELLTAPGEDVNTDVWRERKFSVLLDNEGTDEMWNGSFDRVVLVRDADGNTTGATIIDYKSDAVTEDSVGDRVEHYRPQLEAYRKVLGSMTGLEPAVIRLQLAFLVPGVVVDC
jgi:ATP-dependent helicase/nuclease subunit A